MRIDIPWGTTTVPVEVDPSRVAGVLSANVGAAPDPQQVLRDALGHEGASLKEFLSGAPSPLLVVVNDGTRPTPSADVLRVIGADLEAWLEHPGRELSFAIATGTHRPALPEEHGRIFGGGFAEAHERRIHSHEATDEGQLVYLGQTRRGTPVQANRLLARARSLVLINSVEPHYFAGYTGGRKSLVPGLAGYETVWANHKLSMEAGSDSLVLAGNPVHEDLEEATGIAVAGRQVFSIQLVLDRNHRAGFATAGTLEDTFRRAVAVADGQFVLDLEQPCDVVVAVAPHPMDCNLYQTNKAIQSGALAVKDGGVLIVVSECPFGLGENRTLFDLLAAAGSPAEAIERANLEDYRLGVQQAARIAAILQRSEIWAVTSLQDADLRSMFMTPFPDIQSAMDSALVKQGPDAQVLFLLEASITVPRVRALG